METKHHSGDRLETSGDVEESVETSVVDVTVAAAGISGGIDEDIRHKIAPRTRAQP